MQPATRFPESCTIMTYNILVGGRSGRIPAITSVIRACQADIIGIEEANDPDAIRRMADDLGMHAVIGYTALGYHVALLSRFPILSWANYGRPVFQKGLIEAVIAVPGEPLPWHVFVGHLTADFFQGWRAERRRMRELHTFVECMALARANNHPHVLLGDFNALTPGEPFDLMQLVECVAGFDRQRKEQQVKLPGQPHLGYIVPPVLHPFMPIIRQIPRVRWLARLINRGVNALIPRAAVNAVTSAGYTDCLATSYAPDQIPPTCPNPAPAGRIDYIFADPLAATRLTACDVVQEGPDCPVSTASDHRPVLARFAMNIGRQSHKVSDYDDGLALRRS